ncbi:hypothetical protein B0H14DRAFT_2556923 [Mycena olivaceomarginata]|nr:hypothetical protein B0H14DRAFT_2556923 [Mycena olivaceomarginata]
MPESDAIAAAGDFSSARISPGGDVYAILISRNTAANGLTVRSSTEPAGQRTVTATAAKGCTSPNHAGGCMGSGQIIIFSIPWLYDTERRSTCNLTHLRQPECTLQVDEAKRRLSFSSAALPNPAREPRFVGPVSKSCASMLHGLNVRTLLVSVAPLRKSHSQTPRNFSDSDPLANTEMSNQTFACEHTLGINEEDSKQSARHTSQRMHTLRLINGEVARECEADWLVLHIWLVHLGTQINHAYSQLLVAIYLRDYLRKIREDLPVKSSELGSRPHTECWLAVVQHIIDSDFGYDLPSGNSYGPPGIPGTAETVIPSIYPFSLSDAVVGDLLYPKSLVPYKFKIHEERDNDGNFAKTGTLLEQNNREGEVHLDDGSQCRSVYVASRSSIWGPVSQ